MPSFFPAAVKRCEIKAAVGVHHKYVPARDSKESGPIKYNNNMFLFCFRDTVLWVTLNNWNKCECCLLLKSTKPCINAWFKVSLLKENIDLYNLILVFFNWMSSMSHWNYVSRKPTSETFLSLLSCYIFGFLSSQKCRNRCQLGVYYEN